MFFARASVRRHAPSMRFPGARMCVFMCVCAYACVCAHGCKYMFLMLFVVCLFVSVDVVTLLLSLGSLL